MEPKLNSRGFLLLPVGTLVDALVVLILLVLGVSGTSARAQSAINGDAPLLTPTPIPCNIEFTDVPPSYVFYNNIRCLVCRDIISGYQCGGVNSETGQPEPCDGQNRAYFRPENRITRGQMAKIVSNAAGFQDDIPPGRQTFEDVPATHTFWLFVERLAVHGNIIGGYSCGGVGEPCVPPGNRPYFRAHNSVTRGQTAKIVSNAAGFDDDIPPDRQSFVDVPPGSTFWLWVERLHARNIISGTCDPTGACFYRPLNSIKRGQLSKVTSNTFFPECGQ